MHSTSDLIEDKFDGPDWFYNKETADTSGFEHGKHKEKPLSGPLCDPKPKTSRTSKGDSSQYSPNTRHSDLNDDSTPGPGAYRPEEAGTMRAVYRNAPSYSLVSRRRDIYDDYARTPGPGTYSLQNSFPHKPQAPHYSLGMRHSWYKAPFVVEYKE